MKRMLVLITSLFVCLSSHAAPFNGVLKITGGFIGSSAATTGDIDVAGGSLLVNPSFIYGLPATFIISELLASGSHTRSYTPPSGITITRTESIPSGKVGGYFVIESNGMYYQIFNAWTVSSDGGTYTPVNFPGNLFNAGSLNGYRANLDFAVPPPPAPTMSLSVEMAGGTIQECTSPAGAVISVSANATIIGDTVLDRVDWYLDDDFVGTGVTLDLVVPLGMHDLVAVGMAMDGITSAMADLAVNIRDTTAPALEIQFLNGQGQPVTSASIGSYSVHFSVSDACDPAPVVTAAAKPVMDVSEGDLITINSVVDVQLPTTAVEVTANARDATGRVGYASAKLAIH